jgi:hypothetical protein
MARLASGKKAPIATIIDSQSVRTASQPGVGGYDAGKKITGKKRHVLVDTQGNIIALKVTTADVQDREGAQLLLSVLTVAFGCPPAGTGFVDRLLSPPDGALPFPGFCCAHNGIGTFNSKCLPGERKFRFRWATVCKPPPPFP